MTSRFQLLSNDDIEKLSKNAENENTNKSTNNWIRVYKQWAVTLMIEDSGTLAAFNFNSCFSHAVIGEPLNQVLAEISINK